MTIVTIVFTVVQLHLFNLCAFTIYMRLFSSKRISQGCRRKGFAEMHSRQERRGQGYRYLKNQRHKFKIFWQLLCGGFNCCSAACCCCCRGGCCCCCCCCGRRCRRRRRRRRFACAWQINMRLAKHAGTRVVWHTMAKMTATTTTTTTTTAAAAATTTLFYAAMWIFLEATSMVSALRADQRAKILDHLHFQHPKPTRRCYLICDIFCPTQAPVAAGRPTEIFLRQVG